MIICYDHFMLVQFAHVRIRQNDYSLELPSLGRPEANLGNPVQRCAQDMAQVVSMQPARSSSLGSFSCPYSPKCRELEFCELRLLGILRSSALPWCFRAHTLPSYRRMLRPSHGQRTPREGAGPLPVLLLDQGQLPSQNLLPPGS